MIALNLKGDISQKFPGKTHYLRLGRSKLKAAHPVNYFPRVLGRNIKNFNTHPVNYSNTSLPHGLLKVRSQASLRFPNNINWKNLIYLNYTSFRHDPLSIHSPLSRKFVIKNYLHKFRSVSPYDTGKVEPKGWNPITPRALPQGTRIGPWMLQ